MTTKRGKTKPSAPKSDEKRSPHQREGSPFLHVEAPSHRLPGQPVGINYSLDRSRFDPGFHPNDFVKLCQEGATRFEICAAWGISEGTLSLWREQYDEFKAVYEIGATAQKAWLARKVRTNLDNKGANSILLIFASKNMLNWGDEGKTDFDDIQSTELDFEYSRRAK